MVIHVSTPINRDKLFHMTSYQHKTNKVHKIKKNSTKAIFYIVGIVLISSSYTLITPQASIVTKMY